MNLTYEPIKKLPVAKFYYKGSHSHPVRRTILIIESNNNILRGYELREGSITRTLKKSPIKSFKKNKIAKYSDLGKANHKNPGPKESTLKRMSLLDFLQIGV